MINQYIKNSNSVNHYKNFEDKVIDIDWKTINYNRIAFINKAVNQFTSCKYLEIGCETNTCFNAITTKNKIGIDPEQGGTIKTTSDEFFQNNKNFYDVIFIDGLHRYEQCRKDIMNSLNFLNDDGYIFVHDLVPRSWIEANVPRLQTMWTGDTWKVSFELLKTDGIDFNVILADHGIGMIKKKKKKIIYHDDFINLNELKFSDFLNKINEINFLHAEDALQLISK
tara:strand:+ start:932 stop:1606 length:675 start_codon:yes stop_codon:yes gene_type:complete